MAQAVNVLLDVGSEEFNLNNMGLVSLTFDRFIASQLNQNKNILTNMDITMFDSTGYKLLSLLQKQNGLVKVKYGFEDNMSETFNLTMVKFKSTYNNMGVMVSVGAVGTQLTRKYPAEIFHPGTSVNEMLRMFAGRNGWYVGSAESNMFINVGNLRIDRILVKPNTVSDIDFIVNSVIPVCNRVVTSDIDNKSLLLWDVNLVTRSSRIEFYFRKLTQKSTPRRVWKYSYGERTDGQVLGFTNSIDQTYLINGLTIQIPATQSDYLIDPEGVRIELEGILESKKALIAETIERYGLPIVSPNDFIWNIEIIPTEDTGTVDNISDIIVQRLDQIMQILNTIEIEVVGNPKIMPMDLVELVIKNRGKDGDIGGIINPLSSNSATGGYWRIIGIKENIGIAGYTTSLRMVRDYVNLIFEKTTSPGSGGLGREELEVIS